MASFPGSKVHRPSRRKLGRGQHLQLPLATFVMTSSTNTAILTFSVPVVVSGQVDLHVSGGLGFVSQVQLSPQVLHVLYDGAVGGKTWSVGPGEPVATFQGGGLAPQADTF